MKIRALSKTVEELKYIADEVEYLFYMNIFDNDSYAMALKLKSDIKKRCYTLEEAELIHYAFYPKDEIRTDVLNTLKSL